MKKTSTKKASARKPATKSLVELSKLVLRMRDEGETVVLARPTLSLRLYYDLPVGRLGPIAGAVLDDYLAFVAPFRPARYMAESGNHAKLTEKIVDKWRASLLAMKPRDKYFSLTFGPGLEDGPAYGFRFTGSALTTKSIPDETNLLALEFPPALLADRGPDAFIELVTRTCDRAPFHVGLFGYAFQHAESIFSNEAMEAIAKVALRYRGFDVSDDLRYDMKGHVYSVSWLNLLGDDLVAALGGAASLRKQLPAGAELRALEHGILIRSSRTPVVGDVQQGSAELAPLKRLAKALRPLRLESEDLLGVDDEGFSERWLSRLD